MPSSSVESAEAETKTHRYAMKATPFSPIPTARLLGVASDWRAEEVFELLMGSVVAPRRDFIVAGAAELDRARLDV